MGARDDLTDAGDVERLFESRFDASPTAVARAPGRVNLVGGHVDYADGLVLPVGIDRATVVAARPHEDGRIRSHSIRLDDRFEADVPTDVDPAEMPDGWGAYVVGTAAVLSEAVGEPLGADLLVGGDLVLGAGLSSSAALEVAVAGALDALYDLDLDPKSLADRCWRAETEAVGVGCGILDQYASALARPGHATKLDCRSREVEFVPFDPAAASLLVVDTGVRHELADSGYNDRVRECRAAAERLDAVLDREVRSLRDVSPEQVAAHADALPAPLDRRARHVASENRRVEDAAAALADGRLDRVGELLSASHRSLRDDHEVSSAELDAAVAALEDREGVLGARMVGGGWGGSVVALVRPGAEEAVESATGERYREATGRECDVYAVGVGGGLEVWEPTSA